MLVQHPILPGFGITGDFHLPASIPFSFNTKSSNPTGTLAQPYCPTSIPLNCSISIQQLLLFALPGQSAVSSLHRPQQISNLGLDLSMMPRQTQPKVTMEVVFDKHTPAVTGCKRNSSALSESAPVNDPLNNIDDQLALKLPPKPKESERMMHVQRWVNHLPWNGDDCTTSNATQLRWGYGNTSGYRRIDDDRELTPPPGRMYVSRLPFSSEEHQTMLRFLSADSAQQMHQTAAGIQHQHGYHTEHATAFHQTSAHQRIQPAIHNQLVADGDATRLDRTKLGVGGNRFFVDWETQLINNLFQDFFQATGERTSNLPSLGVVRNRIATSRLKETRTATAVRSKIRRMQSVGNWNDYQKF